MTTSADLSHMLAQRDKDVAFWPASLRRRRVAVLPTQTQMVSHL